MILNNIATIRAGYPFRGKIPEQADAPVVVVQMKNITWHEGIRWSECTRTRLAGKRTPDYLLASDILVVARGSHNYAIQVGQGPSAPPRQAVAAPHFYMVRLEERGILPEFMVWLLNQPPIQHYFAQHAEGTLTKNIRRTILADTPIVEPPPLARQRAIVALANTQRKEYRLMQQWIQNSERMMNAITSDLYRRPTATDTARIDTPLAGD